MTVTTALMDIREKFYICMHTESHTGIFEAMQTASSRVKCRILNLREGAVCPSKTLASAYKNAWCHNPKYKF